MDSKRCCQCKIVKFINEFHKDSTAKNSRSPRCAQCDNENHVEYRKKNPNKVKENNVKYSKLYKDRQRGYDIKRNYGITLEECTKMWHIQNNSCAICMKNIKPGVGSAIDHNHKTGEIRGLLCQKCNAGLGMFDDNILILSNAISYIKRFERPKEDTNRYGL